MTDIKNLLQKVKHHTDSPLQSKVAELTQQWQNCKLRLNGFLPTPHVPDISVALHTFVCEQVDMGVPENEREKMESANLFLAMIEKINSTDEKQVSNEI
jgi:hypothetical protein